MNMELIIKDIKDSLANCSPDELEKRISIWRNQFRERGISIIALETLLNFYSKSHPMTNAQTDDDFVSLYSATHHTESNENAQLIRNELDKLRKEKRELQKKNAKWQKLCLIVSLLAVFFILVTIYVSFLR